jgi:hypothetical protein
MSKIVDADLRILRADRFQETTQSKIERMICARAKMQAPLDDNLSGYYYNHLPLGTKKYQNFRAFYHFFEDVELAFGILFPISVWDRDWKISQFTAYVEKLISQPGRSLVNGRKRLVEEFHPFYIITLTICLAASVLLMTFNNTALGGFALALLFINVSQKKVRRIFRLKKLLRINEQRTVTLTRRSKQQLNSKVAN